MGIDYDAFKAGQRTMWSAGDYPQVARRIESVAEELAERAGAGPGMELLDVATGSGNVALAAARAGASVTGLDLTPRLLDAARARAAEAGVELRLIEGDAEKLPFADRSFDAVTSCFGVMFAPRQEVAAAELVRVARPGARVVVAAWTPEGMIGEQFRLSASFMPAPPPELKPPVLWGSEEHVRALFAGAGAEATCELRSVVFSGPSVEEWVANDEQVLGPAVLAKAALEPQGRWQELRAQMLELYERRNEASDGSFSAKAEYLLTTAHSGAAA